MTWVGKCTFFSLSLSTNITLFVYIYAAVDTCHSARCSALRVSPLVAFLHIRFSFSHSRRLVFDKPRVAVQLLYGHHARHVHCVASSADLPCDVRPKPMCLGFLSRWCLLVRGHFFFVSKICNEETPCEQPVGTMVVNRERILINTRTSWAWWHFCTLYCICVWRNVQI